MFQSKKIPSKISIPTPTLNILVLRDHNDILLLYHPSLVDGREKCKIDYLLQESKDRTILHKNILHI